MDSAQILHTLEEVPSFLGVYPSDILPPPPSLTRSVTLIVNKDPHTPIEALIDIQAYVNAAIASDNYVEPAPKASRSIIYRQMFEELKSPV